MSQAPIRVVLLGYGNMGKNHYRTLMRHSGFQLIAVLDPYVNELPITEGHQVKLLSDLESLKGLSFDCAVVATPTPTHFETVRFLLNLNVNVLVEKPAASSYAECLELRRLALEKGLKLYVGNIERCNPAVTGLKKVLDSQIVGTPVHFDAMRAGAYPREVKPGNHVVLDLAVHEFDALNVFIGDVKVQSAVCVSKKGNGIFDIAEILLRNDQNVSMSIHVNWLSNVRVRSLRVTCSQGICVMDYINQSVMIYGHNIVERIPENWQIESYKNDGDFYEKVALKIEKQEPLMVQLEEFFKGLNGQSTRLCDVDHIAESVFVAEECARISDQAQAQKQNPSTVVATN